MNKKRGTRLNMTNIQKYIDEIAPNAKREKSGTISGYLALDQNNYGGDNDCTVTSITALCHYKFTNKNQTVEQIYNQVDALCTANGINVNKRGVPPYKNKMLIDKMLNVKSTQKYIKDVGFNWQTITNQIDNKNPVLLSLWNDGRNYYRNHTVSIIGYMQYDTVKILIIYDNWYKTPSYLDYNKLCNICCINYV